MIGGEEWKGSGLGFSQDLNPGLLNEPLEL